MRKCQLQCLYHHNEVIQITLMAENNLSNRPPPPLSPWCVQVQWFSHCRVHQVTHFNTDCLVPSPELNSTCLWWSPGICFSHKLPGDADTAGVGLHLQDTLGEPRGQRLACLESWLTDGLKLWLNCTCLGMASSPGRRTPLRMRCEGVLRTHSNGTQRNCSSGCGVINFVILINLFAY